MLIACLALAYFSIFFILKVAQYNSLFSFEWEDDAANNQMAWNTAQGRLFYQSIFNGRFSGHVNPIIFIIALGYIIFPHIFTWYFLSISGVVFGGLIIQKIAYRAFGNKLKTFLITLLYFSYPPLHYLLLGKMNTMTFFVPLILVSFYFFQKEKFSYFIISLVFAMMCKESVALYVIMFSIFAAICRKKKKWIVLPIILGIVWFIISTWFILPYVSNVNFNIDTSGYHFYSLDRYTFLGLIKFIIFHPKECFAFMFSREHLVLITRLFLPVCFVPISSLVTLIAIPGFLQLLFVNGPLHYSASHYLSGIIPFIILGYIYGLVRIDIILNKFQAKSPIKDKISYIIVFASILMCVMTSFGNNIYGTLRSNRRIYDPRFLNVKNIFNPVFYKMDPGDKIAWSMINQIPDTSSVSASGDLLIPLSHRRELLEFGNKEVEYDYFNVEYIILNKKSMYYGAGNYSEIKEEDLKKLDYFVKNGKFKILSKKGDFVLLKNIQR